MVDYTGGYGVNYLFFSGISLSLEAFWHDDPYMAIGFYLHETRHSFFPYFGHTSTRISEIFPGVLGDNKYSYLDFINFLKQTQDQSGASIHSYINAKAERDRQ
jgi:hypothetical protein